MATEPNLRHISFAMTDEQRRQAETIRAGAEQDFPPKPVQPRPVPFGIARQIEDARKQRGMTRYALGQSANVPSTIVRAIEQGDEVPLSQFHAVVAALGLTIELVEQT